MKKRSKRVTAVSNSTLKMRRGKALFLFSDDESVTQREQNYGLTLGRLYSVREVCQFMGISDEYFRSLVKNRHVTAFLIAGTYKVSGYELRRYLQSVIV